MNCENTTHNPESGPFAAIATVHLIGSDATDNVYAVCGEHLVEYVNSVFVGQAFGSRLPFEVWPAGAR